MSMIDVPKTAGQRIISQVGKNQDVYEQLSIQISSGQRHQDFKGYASEGNVERLLSANEVASGINDYKRSNALATNRLNSMETSLDQLQGIADQISGLITTARNSASADAIPVVATAEALLEEIAGKLNVKFNDKYLFSGSKTDTPPVDNLKTSNIIDGEASANYYHGDSNIATVRASDTQEVAYGVNANEEAFQKLIGAVNLLIDGVNNGDAGTLEKASAMASDANEGVIYLQVQVKSSLKTLSNINQSHEDASALITDNLSQIRDTDIVEASALLSQVEVLIQASYMAYTRLNSLNLVNFL